MTLVAASWHLPGRPRAAALLPSITLPGVCGGFPKLGYPFGGPHIKDYSMLGSTLGSPYFGKLPCITLQCYLPQQLPELAAGTQHLALCKVATKGGGFLKLRVFFWGSPAHNKDHSILGSILESQPLWKVQTEPADTNVDGGNLEQLGSKNYGNSWE